MSRLVAWMAAGLLAAAPTLSIAQSGGVPPPQ